MKRKLITVRGELVISDEKREIWRENRNETGFRILFNKLKDIGNDYLFTKYGIKHFLG